MAITVTAKEAREIRFIGRHEQHEDVSMMMSQEIIRAASKNEDCVDISFEPSDYTETDFVKIMLEMAKNGFDAAMVIHPESETLNIRVCW